MFPVGRRVFSLANPSSCSLLHTIDFYHQTGTIEQRHYLNYGLSYPRPQHYQHHHPQSPHQPRPLVIFIYNTVYSPRPLDLPDA